MDSKELSEKEKLMEKEKEEDHQNRLMEKEKEEDHQNSEVIVTIEHLNGRRRRLIMIMNVSKDEEK